MTDQDTYNRIKSALLIDPMRLTEELMTMPQLQSDASEGFAEAQRERDEAKDVLDIAKSTASAELRYPPEEPISPGLPAKQPKALSEERIKSEIVLDQNVQDAMDALRTAEYNLALWKGLADSVRAKNGAIRAMADLIQSGYATRTSIYEERKREIDRVRRR